MDLMDQIPIFIRSLGDRPITEDSSIVDDDVDPPEVVKGSLDEGLTVLDGVIIGNSFSSFWIET